MVIAVMIETTKCICGKTSCEKTRCENIRKMDKIFKSALAHAINDFGKFLEDAAIKTRSLEHVIRNASVLVTEVYYFVDSLKDCVSEVTMGEKRTIKTIAKAVKYDGDARKRKCFDPTIQANISIFKLLANNLLETSELVKSESSGSSSFERGGIQTSITVGQFSHEFFRLDTEGCGLSVGVHEGDDPRSVAQIHRNSERTKKSYSTLLRRAYNTMSSVVYHRKTFPANFVECENRMLTTSGEFLFKTNLQMEDTSTKVGNLEKRIFYLDQLHSHCSKLRTPENSNDYATCIAKGTTRISSCKSTKPVSTTNSFWRRMCCWK